MTIELEAHFVRDTQASWLPPPANAPCRSDSSYTDPHLTSVPALINSAAGTGSLLIPVAWGVAWHGVASPQRFRGR